jgi:formiminoglutamase
LTVNRFTAGTGAQPGRDRPTARPLFHAPYHAALSDEIARLRQKHPRIVLYDCHSIRSRIPRLFEGELPHLNLGTNSGASCDPALQEAIEEVCAVSPFSWVANGRFKGGWITRQYGRPEVGVHAVQMELACRSYLEEPSGPVDEKNWPAGFEFARAGEMQKTLKTLLSAIQSWT